MVNKTSKITETNVQGGRNPRAAVEAGTAKQAPAELTGIE